MRLKASAASPEQFVVYLSTKEGRSWRRRHSRAPATAPRRLRAPQRRAQAAAHLVRREPRGGGAQAPDVPALARGRRRAGRGASSACSPPSTRRCRASSLPRPPSSPPSPSRRPTTPSAPRRARARRHRRAPPSPRLGGRRRRARSLRSRCADLPVAPRHLPPERSDLLGLVLRPSPSAPSAPAASMASSSRPIGTLPTVRIGTCRRRCRAGCCRRQAFRVVSLMVRPDYRRRRRLRQLGGRGAVRGGDPATVCRRREADAALPVAVVPATRQAHRAPTSSQPRRRWQVADIEQQPVAIALAAMDDQHGHIFNKGFGGVDRPSSAGGRRDEGGRRAGACSATSPRPSTAAAPPLPWI